MKQKNKIRFLLVAVLAGVSVMGYAQGKWCTSATATPYEIVQVTAPSDAGATFQWKQDGVDISEATSANLTLPTNLTEGKYTYIRYAKKADCPDAVASNAFTVEVLTCGEIGAGIGAKGTITDLRDNKVYKVVRMPDGKVWMAENLNYQAGLKFNAQSNQAKGVLFTASGSGVPAIGSFWCPQENGLASSVTASQNTCNVYGALYTWETAMSENGLGTWDENAVSGKYLSGAEPPSGQNCAQAGGRGICPATYRVPTALEWAEMLDAVESAGYTTQNYDDWFGTSAGKLLKSASTFLGADPGTGTWADDQNRGEDFYGLSIVPSGARNPNGASYTARGTITYLMTSSPENATNYHQRSFGFSQPGSRRMPVPRSQATVVRCVRD
jgi:uncharacterized protein (TIGR02145 family)